VSILVPCPLLSSQARTSLAPSTTSALASRASSSLHIEPIIEPIPNPQPELIPAPNTQTHTVSLSNPTPVTSPKTSQSPDTTSATHPSHPSSHPMVTRSKNHITKPKHPLDGMIRYPLPKALLAVGHNFISKPEPTCFTTAAKSHAWHQAMNLEFDALLQKDTSSLASFLEPHWLQMGLSD
jgi:hypothetical protein